MNVYDYLLGQSGFLYKPFLLGNKEELTYQELYKRVHEAGPLPGGCLWTGQQHPV